MNNTSNANPQTKDEREPIPLWNRILGLIEQDLAQRRRDGGRELFVQVWGEAGLCRKEAGELSASERQSLHPALGERVAQLLLERYLAEQGRVDLLERRRAYTKNIEELTPEDLPALIEADRQRAEEEEERRQKERERAEEELVREARADSTRLLVAEMTAEAAKEEARR